jgi:SulP family sulfate permease
MPTVTPTSRHSVVILRIRGSDDAGATFLDILGQYASALRDADCKLMLVTNNQHVIDQVHNRYVTEAIGLSNLYHGTSFVGETVRQAYADALEWVAQQTAEAAESAESAETVPASRRSRPEDLPSDQLGL